MKRTQTETQTGCQSQREAPPHAPVQAGKGPAQGREPGGLWPRERHLGLRRPLPPGARAGVLAHGASGPRVAASGCPAPSPGLGSEPVRVGWPRADVRVRLKTEPACATFRSLSPQKQDEQRREDQDGENQDHPQERQEDRRGLQAAFEERTGGDTGKGGSAQEGGDLGSHQLFPRGPGVGGGTGPEAGGCRRARTDSHLHRASRHRRAVKCCC